MARLLDIYFLLSFCLGQGMGGLSSPQQAEMTVISVSASHGRPFNGFWAVEKMAVRQIEENLNSHFLEPVYCNGFQY